MRIRHKAFGALRLYLLMVWPITMRYIHGESPAGATTVVNPIDATSPVPAGSCVITGAFSEPLIINGDETGELYISLSFSNNQSFEWVDTNGNGQWDIDATNPENTESVTDMGLRGMIPSWEWK